MEVGHSGPLSKTRDLQFDNLTFIPAHKAAKFAPSFSGNIITEEFIITAMFLVQSHNFSTYISWVQIWMETCSFLESLVRYL